MKLIQYEKLSKDKYRLFLDNGEVIDTYEDVILDNGIFYLKEIDSLLYDKIMKETVIQKYYHDCLSYIKVRLRSEKEIREYLKRKKVDDSQIQIIVDKLSQRKIIDDDYFCQCFIHDKLKFSCQGEYKIINELKSLGISEEIIQGHYDLFDREILQEKIDKLIGKYLKSNKKMKGIALKNKVYHNLMNQGFDKEMILSSFEHYEF